MTIYEIIQSLFAKDQNDAIINNLSAITEAFSKQTDKVVIDIRGVEDYDATNKRQDPTYLLDQNLIFTEDGIKMLIATPESSEILKPLIPRTVKELTVPSTMLTDLSFLNEFPNLEELTISDHSAFEKADLDYIRENTNIKTINFRSSITFNNIKGQDGCHMISGRNMIASVDGLIIKHPLYPEKWSKNLEINTSSYENPKEIRRLYDIISPELEELDYVMLRKGPDDLDCGNVAIKHAEQKTEIVFKNITPTEANAIYQGISTDNQKFVEYKGENKTYEDFYSLKPINQTASLSVDYPGDIAGSYISSTYEEFQSMRATIDYYKELLTTSNLSPAEQLTFVYDILKTMRYKENPKDNQRSRNIHSIIADGNIVCVGYSKFANQLLTEIGINTTKVSVSVPAGNGTFAGHSRNFVRIDDDKYNIHGVFAMDITFDNDKEVSVIEEDDEKREVVFRPNDDLKDKIVDEYGSLVLYRHLLIPMDQYELRYPEEENPLLYEEYKKDKGKRLALESKAVAIDGLTPKSFYVLGQHEDLFSPEEGPLTVAKYLSAPKPSLETFKEIVTNVRRAEGYNEQEAAHDLERVLELQNMLKEQSGNTPDTFFKPTTK